MIIIFVSLYIVRVHKDDLHRFTKIAQKAKPLIRSYGGEPFLYQEDALTGRHGSMGLLNLFELQDGEVVFLGKVIFPSKEDYTQGMEGIKQDDLLKHLYEQLAEFIDFTSLITSTFYDAESEV
ncbi:DUF1428 family protein [Halobacillus sp. A1]|uniref:DUF1428 family protein n=1 Tax=Halobacillus sp. A1 TaxID=2880262 RepID=UPI0020A6B7CE|nr:DUF1428 family protein [Halobacillus sp. A1]